ncbi:MAG: hypothetical protein IJ751_08955 [Oscillospiraceae bacterium]|nr:hypothetical protein [Oscillospiraceae bacterium]
MKRKRSLYEEITSPAPRATWRSLIPPAVAAAIPAALLGLFHLTKGNKALMNGFLRYVTHPIHRFLSWL